MWGAASASTCLAFVFSLPLFVFCLLRITLRGQTNTFFSLHPPTSPARFNRVRDETLKKKEKEKSGDKNLETLGTKRSSSIYILHMCP